MQTTNSTNYRKRHKYSDMDYWQKDNDLRREHWKSANVHDDYGYYRHHHPPNSVASFRLSSLLKFLLVMAYVKYGLQL
ncbi:hypothetical protein FQR65_LT02479 [Abscondita terminalis]|nr:hypothetical protein FQR65_LT02479 [Abscondita terminalis]